MTTKGRMTPAERAETLADLRVLLADFDQAAIDIPSFEKFSKMAESLRRAIEELEAAQ